ncbi:cytochrome c oxidase subunit II transmembrane domain-containing protein [Candidatus Carsonella ruddii]|uniref:cytochrome c oxidase subunit II transmembrane domain-containing protein n=1 Tax=Carsonella ruddii TaxID=114186 RepID=UPI003D3AFD33
MSFQDNEYFVDAIKIHFLGINRFLENKLLLNTFYLIFLILIFMLIIFNFLYQDKKKFIFLIDSILIETIIWIIPTLIILLISLYTIKSSFYLNPFKNIYLNIKPLIIESISLNWKWMFIFPHQKILSFNEICLPIFIPIKLYLISNSIMNSLCIPKMGFQLYCMTNCIKYAYMLPLKHGISHAISSNYSGIGFKSMRINIFFVSKKTFFHWINVIKNLISFNIKNYNKIIKRGYFYYPKFFSIKNNKIFFSILKKK